MLNYGKQISYHSNYQERKRLLQSLNRERSDILLLKKRTSNRKKVEWPIPIERKLINNLKALYTTDAISKPKKISKKFIVRSYDRFTVENVEKSTTKIDTHEQPHDLVNEFIEHFVSQQLKPRPEEKMDDSTLNLIQNVSIDLLDNTLLSIVNSQTEPRASSEKMTLDWEFILGNMVQQGLPQSVVDRVKRKMALITGKDTPAITAMNVAQTVLSDLTITTAEEEMQQEINKLVKKNERFESIPEDEAFKLPVKWLVDLDKKDQHLQTEEIEKIHTDYSNRVLDLKPAFF